MNAPAAIAVEALSKRFGDFVAVDAIDLDVCGGEVFGLLGANGAGKTTVIRMLCGMLAANAGRIEVAGIDMIRRPRQARGRIGYVSQGFTLYRDMTVRENLALQAGLYGLARGAAQQRVAWAEDYLELAAHATLPARELPLGYQRRLSLAAALLHRPQVLFLDEPTSGVDPLARQHFWELIYDLADDGIAILVTTHYMDEAAFCDRLALMHAGRIVEQATPEALLARPLPTAIVELQTAGGGAGSAWLAQRPEVLEVVPHAGRLRVRLQAGVAAQDFSARIAAAARRDGITIEALQPVAAGLEDVFVAILEQAAEEG